VPPSRTIACIGLSWSSETFDNVAKLGMRIDNLEETCLVIYVLQLEYTSAIFG
jgi:hypothetical protein